MNDIGPDQTEVDVVSYEVADDVLEAAAGNEHLAGDRWAI